MGDIIQASEVCFSYPDAPREAVRKVSFTVREGEFLAILGHNGSGKSTLARLMNGLLLPTGGQLLVAGLDARSEESLWDIRRQCGMVFQNPDNQLVASIVEEDVAFGPENLGLPPAEIRARVDEALDLVDMGAFHHHAPHMLSGGQKQRVAIAGVVAMRPRVIVFDEATAMLDPRGREEVLRVAHMLCRQEGLTVVWITHFMEEAALASRVLVMDDGAIALSGRPREVFSQVDRMRALGLDVPEMTHLAALLREDGVPVAGDILTVEEMAVALCRLK